MSSAPRLRSLADISGPAMLPDYEPERHGCGIVHVGVGAFHRAHQAVYTDAALAAKGGDWRITGVSLRSTEIAGTIDAQNGLYTLLERQPESVSGRVIGSIAHVIPASRDLPATLSALCAPHTRIVSLTVTEKAYGIDRSRQVADVSHPAVAADLTSPHQPVGVLGLITESQRLRRADGIPPFTVLCCDNLPENGALLRAGVIDFGRRANGDAFAEWIAGSVSFPSSMVDRITPAATRTTLDDAQKLTGCIDLAAVETEPFTQWVIEDDFPEGRPAWEAGGALFVEDVKPYEQMKLRVLNGAHSLAAYAGFVSGSKYVRDVMADDALRALIARHMAAAADTLPPLHDIDLKQYQLQLLARFANPAIAHETYQIAMDGTQKLPQRILSPALEALRAGDDIASFSFAVAAWMRYCLGRDEAGNTYALRDPREEEIRNAVGNANTPEAISAALHGLPDLFDHELAGNESWRAAVRSNLDCILNHGIHAALSGTQHR